MSEITFDNVIRAALTTKRAASEIAPRDVDPWSVAFRAAFQRHLDDEAVRWLAAKGCQGFVRTGEHCPGAPTLGDSRNALCIACEAGTVVIELDRTEAAIRLKWAQEQANRRYDGIMGEQTTET